MDPEEQVLESVHPTDAECPEGDDHDKAMSMADRNRYQVACAQREAREVLKSVWRQINPRKRWYGRSQHEPVGLRGEMNLEEDRQVKKV